MLVILIVGYLGFVGLFGVCAALFVGPQLLIAGVAHVIGAALMLGGLSCAD